ncbi:MAG: D-alanyl-D-alanine carboxypeptidase, partial [Muribaculaceae bacterium]|nr:D-alanyl-D-alanine carboxypeptidase [Muribaculaceae bacterium]
AGMPDSIARRLFDMGVRKIGGRVVVDTLGLQEQGPGYGWEYSDLRHSYGAGLYALNYRDNATEGARAVTDPVRRFTSEVGRAFTRNGIELTDSVMDSDRNMSLLPVYIHRSPTKEEILRVMMEQSHNLYAEAMLRALAPGSECEEALQREVDLLSSLGLDMTCLNAFDGSGLSRQDALTPLFMADMLQRMAATPFADRYVALFPKAGLEGTVKRFLCDTPLEGRMVLKSGSMRGVQTFAGYKLDDCGKPTHVVVIMVNQFVCNRDAVRKAMTNMLLRYFPG